MSAPPCGYCKDVTDCNRVGCAYLSNRDDAFEKLREDIRSTLSIHVDNRADVGRILKLVMLSIKERLPCHSIDKYDETRKGA